MVIGCVSIFVIRARDMFIARRTCADDASPLGTKRCAVGCPALVGIDFRQPVTDAIDLVWAAVVRFLLYTSPVAEIIAMRFIAPHDLTFAPNTLDFACALDFAAIGAALTTNFDRILHTVPVGIDVMIAIIPSFDA